MIDLAFVAAISFVAWTVKIDFIFVSTTRVALCDTFSFMSVCSFWTDTSPCGIDWHDRCAGVWFTMFFFFAIICNVVMNFKRIGTWRFTTINTFSVCISFETWFTDACKIFFFIWIENGWAETSVAITILITLTSALYHFWLLVINTDETVHFWNAVAACISCISIFTNAFVYTYLSTVTLLL